MKKSANLLKVDNLHQLKNGNIFKVRGYLDSGI